MAILLPFSIIFCLFLIGNYNYNHYYYYNNNRNSLKETALLLVQLNLTRNDDTVDIVNNECKMLLDDILKESNAWSNVIIDSYYRSDGNEYGNDKKCEAIVYATWSSFLFFTNYGNIIMIDNTNFKLSVMWINEEMFVTTGNIVVADGKEGPLPTFVSVLKGYTSFKSYIYRNIFGDEEYIYHLHNENDDNADEVRTTRSTNSPQQPYFTNHNYVQMTEFLNQMRKDFGSISRLFSVGKSVENRELYVIEISNHPGVKEAKPNVKLIGNMHGDEVTGREMLIQLIYHLLYNYGKDERVTKMVDNIHIFIMVTMNPDGYELHQRGNKNFIDLNRDFPDPWRHTSSQAQPETIAMMEWMNSERFVLSCNLHGGALVANYPFDGNAAGNNVYSGTPDDSLFRYIAGVYATNHLQMSKSNSFRDGITNGADWYALYGGMQDWNYLKRGTFEITLELSDVKWPPANQFPAFWDDNKPAMLAFIELTLSGLVGTVKSKEGCPIENAKINLSPLQESVSTTLFGTIDTRQTTDEFGKFYRLAAPGSYLLQASFAFTSRGKNGETTITSCESEVVAVNVDASSEQTPFLPGAAVPVTLILNCPNNITIQQSCDIGNGDENEIPVSNGTTQLPSSKPSIADNNDHDSNIYINGNFEKFLGVGMAITLSLLIFFFCVKYRREIRESPQNITSFIVSYLPIRYQRVADENIIDTELGVRVRANEKNNINGGANVNVVLVDDDDDDDDEDDEIFKI